MQEMKVSVLGSGSSGNSIYLSYRGTSILIDAGMSGREINRRLQKCDSTIEELDAVFITHEHNDHITGAGVISRRCDIPIFANKLTWEALDGEIGSIKPDNKKLISGSLSMGPFFLSSFSISHDARDPIGYVVRTEGGSVGIGTDMGYVNSEVKHQLKDLDFLIIESNHDYEMLMQGSYPPHLKRRIKSKQGHLSNDAAAEILPDLMEKKLPRILLAHLSRDNNMPDLAYITIKNRLEAAGLKVGSDLDIEFTYHDRPTKLFCV